MRVLVNYDQQHENYKSTIAALLKSKGLTGLATGKTLTIQQLLDTAKTARCEAILLANEETLNNCISSSKKVSLDKYRGSRLNFSIPAIVCAPLNHLRIVKYGRWLYEKDIEKIKKVKQPILQLQFTTCDTVPKLDALYEKAKHGEIVSTDIETDANSRITCVGISILNPNLTTTTAIIPFIDFGTDHYKDDFTYGYAIQTMRAICALPNAKLFFNGLYDASHLITYNAEPNNFVLDSMALAHAEFAELPKTLDFVASIHLHDYLFWKDEADDARKKSDIQAYWAYCARDSWNTLRCFIAQIRTTKQYAFRNYQELFKMVYPYMYCAFEGVLLEQQVLNENRQKAEKIVETVGNDLCVMAADKDFNPKSPKQVGSLLFDVIGAKPVSKRKRNKKTGELGSNRGTDEKTLNKLSDQHPLIRLIVEKILEYRGEVKAISTYFNFPQWRGYDNTIPGRLLYSINPFGTDTGRAASRASSFRLYDLLEEKEADRIKSYGTQIQNIPPYAKNMLVADPDYELGEADNNKSEARCVGFLSGCLALIAALEDRSKDFYRVLGTIFFGLPYEQVTTELRNKVLKRIVHGRNYLMGALTFIEHVGSKQLYEGARLLKYEIKTLKEFATYLLNLYNKPFHEVEDWYKEIKLEVVRNHTLTSPLGYTRYFLGDIMKDHDVFRGAVAHAPQNLSVMILNKGVWRVYKNIVLVEHGDFRLKAQIHDSIFWQSKKEKREYYKAKVLECMNNPVTIKGRVMQIPVDVNFGHSWLDLKT